MVGFLPEFDEFSKGLELLNMDRIIFDMIQY